MFSIIHSTKLINSRLIYKKEEYSFDCSPYIETDVTLFIDYLQVNIDSISGQVLGIRGFNSYKSWLPTKLNIPNYIVGGLKLVEEIESGTSKRISKNIDTYYDISNGIVCIGDKEPIDSESVMISKNIVMTIKEGQLISLWLFPSII